MLLFIQQVIDSFLLHCILQCILQWNLRLKDTFRIKDKIRSLKTSLSYSANTFPTSEERTPLYNAQNNLTQSCSVSVIQRFHSTRTLVYSVTHSLTRHAPFLCLLSGFSRGGCLAGRAGRERGGGARGCLATTGRPPSLPPPPNTRAATARCCFRRARRIAFQFSRNSRSVSLTSRASTTPGDKTCTCIIEQ